MTTMRTVETDTRVLSAAQVDSRTGIPCRSCQYGQATARSSLGAPSNSIGVGTPSTCLYLPSAIVIEPESQSSNQAEPNPYRTAPLNSHMNPKVRIWTISRVPRRLAAFSHIVALLFFVALLPHLASAAFIAFDNCLPDTYVNNDPALLQWVPLFVDASFDTENPNHTLRVTMWGNVTGKSTNVTLPPWNSSDWSDPSKTDGKIVDLPDPNSPKPKRTTLHSKVEVLSYEPWNETKDFCDSALLNGSCPLPPVFNTTVM